VGKQKHNRKGDRLVVFIELPNINYPGSTDRLAFSPGQDRLVGSYVQALERQIFDELFVRQ
jgi:hypothetical protein